MVLIVDHAELSWGYTVDFVLGVDDALILACPFKCGRMILWSVANLECHLSWQDLLGQEMEVLFEKAPRGRSMHGFTRNYIRVEMPASRAKTEYDNQLLKVRLGNFNHDKTALLCI